MKESSQKPLVSVIIPTHNSQKTIRQCLQSIESQTYKEVETIVVDRHSEDETTRIAAQCNVRLLFVTEERSSAKNQAARNAHGDFLLFLDSDMTLAPETIEECVNKCLGTDADAMVIPLINVSHGSLGECRKIERESLSNLSEYVEAPRFFKREAFLKIGGYDEKITCGEDFDLTQRFKKSGRKIAKVSCEMFHLEGNPTLSGVTSKAYYYGKTLPSLIRKKPQDTVKRYASMRLASLRVAGIECHSAKLLLSFALMKTFEFIAYFSGMSIQLAHQFLLKRFQVFKTQLSAHKFLIINSAILTLVSVAVFRNFLFTNEWPGGGDVMGFISRAYLFGKDLRWLYLWRPYSYGFVEGINSMDFFLMIIYWAFRDPASTVKVFMFLSYLGAAFSMYLFAYRYTNRHIAALSASLVYVLNQWLFSQFTEAHADIIFSYALAPLIFFLFDRALRTGKLKDVILLSLSLSLFLTGFHPESVVIYGAFLMVFLLFFLFFPSKNDKFKTRLYRTVKVIVPTTLFVSLLAAFFLIPFFMNVRAPYLHSSYTYPLEDSFGASYANMADAFTLRAVEKWGYVNVVDVYSGLGLPDFPVTPILFVIFILAYCTLAIRRDRYTTFFALSTLVSVFLAKGPHPPFGQFFVWAWTNVPHFAIFRAANRWIMMAIFSDAFFVSLLVLFLANYVEGKTSLNGGKRYFKVDVKKSRSSKNEKLLVSVNVLDVLFKGFRKLFSVLCITLLIFVLLSGFLTSFFFFSQGLQVYTPPQQYLAPYDWLASKYDDYKIISVSRGPSEWTEPLGGESDFESGGMLTGLGWGHDIGFDSSFIHGKPGLQNGGWDFKIRQFIDYLRFRLAREHLTDDLFKILGSFAYDYTVIPSYITNQTRDFFLNQKGYSVVYNQSSMVLQNDYVKPRIFPASQSMFVIGGFESFDELSKIEDFDMGKTVLYYPPEYGDNSGFPYPELQASQFVCFANSDILDLAMISLGKKSVLIHAGDYGFSSQNMTAYWVKWPSWRTIGAYVLGGDILTTVGKNSITIPFELDSDGLYDVFLRIGFAPTRGKLSLSVDGIPVHEFSPVFPLMSKLEWVNITNTSLARGKHSITLENDGAGYNDVDAIAVVKPSELESKTNEIASWLQSFPGRILNLEEAENVFLNNSNHDWYWTVSPYNGYVIRSEGASINVAPLAKANASSDAEFTGAQRAIDGKLDTRWASEKYVLPQWLELTWNSTQRLSGVKIAFENAYATDYAVQTWNGTDWKNETVVTGNDELEREHRFAGVVETDRLRIYVTGYSDYYRVSIWELEAQSTDVASTAARLVIPRKGNYMLTARIATGPNQGTLYFKVNNEIYPVHCNSSVSRYEWREIGPLNLSAGETSIEAGALGPVEFDEMLLYSLEDGETTLSLTQLFDSSTPQVSLTYERTDPCRYIVHVNASEPFNMVFSETYDPLWKAFIGKEEIASSQAYSLVNSFHVNKTGQFMMIVYFVGQDYADMGLAISFISLVTFVVALPIIVRKRPVSTKQKVCVEA